MTDELNKAPQAVVGAELPPLPEMRGAADLGYVLDAPDDWDADYRATWQTLQIADCNRRQWRTYALQLRDILAADRAQQAVVAPNEALRAALRPFADAYAPEADRIEKFFTADDKVKYTAAWDGNTVTPGGINMGHFRHAYEAYKGAGMQVATPGEIVQQAREYQRKVDEKIIAQRDATIADLRAQLARQGQVDLSGAAHLIVFDDRDRAPEFYPVAAAAHARFEHISLQWNAHLYAKVKSNSRDDPHYSRNIGASPAQASAAPAELIELLKAIRPNYGAVGSRDIDVTAQRKRIDRAIELLSASAAPGQARAAVLPEHLFLDLESVIGAVENNDTINARGIRQLYPVKQARQAIELLRDTSLAASPEPATAGTVPVLPDAAMQASKGATDGAVGGAE